LDPNGVHVPPFLQTFATVVHTLLVIVSSQVEPVYGDGHVQYAALLTTVQTPPFLHGDGEQTLAVES
jgi:hypothetical protein